MICNFCIGSEEKQDDFCNFAINICASNEFYSMHKFKKSIII